MALHNFSDLTRQTAFMRLWYSRLASISGQQMLMVAVGWQMYELTGSAWDLGLVGLFQFLPALLLTLVAGHVADRLHRARIVLVCLLVQGLVALVLMAATEGLFAVGPWASRELLLGLSVALGAARAFQMPAQQALMPQLVPPDLLSRAMAFSAGGMQTAVIGGPALGGLIFVAGATAVYASSAGLFFIGCVLMSRVRYVHLPPPDEPVTMRSLLAGLVFVWQRKALLGAVSLDLVAVLLGGATALLPLFAKDILMVGPWGLGLLRAAPAVGALAASMWLTTHPLQRRVGHVLLVAVAVFGCAMALFALSTHFWLSMVALAISGAADTVSVVIRMTLMQLETPDEMRGRVGAVNSIFIGASNELGEFESGAAAAWLGPVMATLVGGLGTILVAVMWLRLFPKLAQRDKLE
jgi:MFS family permease